MQRNSSSQQLHVSSSFAEVDMFDDDSYDDADLSSPRGDTYGHSIGTEGIGKNPQVRGLRQGRSAEREFGF